MSASLAHQRYCSQFEVHVIVRFERDNESAGLVDTESRGSGRKMFRVKLDEKAVTFLRKRKKTWLRLRLETGYATLGLHNHPVRLVYYRVKCCLQNAFERRCH